MVIVATAVRQSVFIKGLPDIYFYRSNTIDHNANSDAVFASKCLRRLSVYASVDN